MNWDIFAPQADPALAAEPSWQAVRAALRQVVQHVETIAQAELAAPSWRPGEGIEHAAFAEGRKAVWRLLLSLACSEGERQ